MLVPLNLPTNGLPVLLDGNGTPALGGLTTVATQGATGLLLSSDASPNRRKVAASSRACR